MVVSAMVTMWECRWVRQRERQQRHARMAFSSRQSSPGTGCCLHAKKCQQQCRQQWQQPCTEERGHVRDGPCVDNTHTKEHAARRQQAAVPRGAGRRGSGAFGTLLRSGGFDFR